MSKHPQSNFLPQWLLVQVFGSIALAIATQAIVTLIIILMQIDDLPTIYLSRLLGYLASSTLQGYLQWFLLKQTIATLDRQWILTAIAGLPLDIFDVEINSSRYSDIGIG